LSLVLVMQLEGVNSSLAEESVPAELQSLGLPQVVDVSSLVESPAIEHDELESLFWGDMPQFCLLGSVCPSVED
jgi:hypothetical protein